MVQDAARKLLLQWARLDTDSSINTTDRTSNGTRRQRNSVHRPVLFVCKSIGGLVVQKVRLGTPYDVAILTSHRLYCCLNQKVETLPLFEELSERYSLSVQ